MLSLRNGVMRSWAKNTRIFQKQKEMSKQFSGKALEGAGDSSCLALGYQVGFELLDKWESAFSGFKESSL